MQYSLVFLNIANSILPITKALRGNIPTQPLDKVVCISANLFRELDDINAFQDDVVDFHWIRAREWWAAQRKGYQANMASLRKSSAVIHIAQTMLFSLQFNGMYTWFKGTIGKYAILGSHSFGQQPYGTCTTREGQTLGMHWKNLPNWPPPLGRMEMYLDILEDIFL